MEFWRLVVVPVVRVTMELVLVVVLVVVVLLIRQIIIVNMMKMPIVSGLVLCLPILQDHRRIRRYLVGLMGIIVPRIVSVAASIVIIWR
jgi:hypothetical protein